MPGRSVLCISFDGVVSDSRCTSLRETGYDVAATTSIDEALDLLDREKFDSVIVGPDFRRMRKIWWLHRPRKRGTRRLCWFVGLAQIQEFLRLTESMPWRATLVFCLRYLDCSRGRRLDRRLQLEL